MTEAKEIDDTIILSTLAKDLRNSSNDQIPIQSGDDCSQFARVHFIYPNFVCALAVVAMLSHCADVLIVFSAFRVWVILSQKL